MELLIKIQRNKVKVTHVPFSEQIIRLLNIIAWKTKVGQRFISSVFVIFGCGVVLSIVVVFLPSP